MKLRAALVTATVLVAGLSGIGHAASTKVCNLVVDGTGDSGLIGPPTPNDDTMDIVSADIATDSTTLTAVIRLKGWSATDTQGLTGRVFYFQFTAPGQPNPIYLSYTASPLVSGYAYGDLEPVAGSSNYTDKGVATGSIAGNEIHMSAKLSDLKSLAKIAPGTKLSALTVDTDALFGVLLPVSLPAAGNGGGLVVPYDEALGKTYTTGTKSCITVGK